MEILAFIGGAVCAGFPLAILYLRAREDRDYFERDRNEKDAELRKLRAVIAKCGPVTSEVRSRIDCEGGWVKAYMPTARDVMDGHALLAGRFDLIEAGK
jgi:hypothetical protein